MSRGEIEPQMGMGGRGAYRLAAEGREGFFPQILRRSESYGGQVSQIIADPAVAYGYGGQVGERGEF
jgi:hypothetical protein